MSSDPNFDPRDEIEARPQVSFDVADGSLVARFAELTTQWLRLELRCHDMMAIDDARGVIRFDWQTPPTVVDRAAEWLTSVPNVVNVRRHYGSHHGAG